MGPHQDLVTRSFLATTRIRIKTISFTIQMPKLKCKPPNNNGPLNIKNDLQMVLRIKMEGIIFIMKEFLVV